MILAPLLLLVLVLTCFLTSSLSAVFGMGGGMVFIAVLANLFPSSHTAQIVPFHATIQMVSNLTRLGLFFRYIQWRVVVYFLIGMIPGSILGIFIFSYIPSSQVKILMGFFILVVTLLPKKKKSNKGQKTSPANPEPPTELKFFIPLGVAIGILGIFFGATGPLTAPFYLRLNILKEQMIATKACCQFATHLLKLPLFAFVAGANILVLWPMILLGACGVICGTLMGKFVLAKLPTQIFKIGLKILLVMAAFRLIWNGCS